MEPQEVEEFAEQQVEAREKKQYIVSFSISVLAVLVALATVMSHRAHTDAVLNQARASDEWALYQARKIRQNNIATTSDLLTVLAPGNAAAKKKISDYQQHTAKWNSDLAASEEKAHRHEEDVEHAEHRAARFDLSEALLQIAVVLCSVTLLTRQRIYWALGLLLGVGGVVSAIFGLLAR